MGETLGLKCATATSQWQKVKTEKNSFNGVFLFARQSADIIAVGDLCRASPDFPVLDDLDFLILICYTYIIFIGERAARLDVTRF